MLYLRLRQNNSGGYFVTDNLQAKYVIIEYNEDQKNKKEIFLRIYSNLDHSYCPCCGERWEDYFDEEDLEETLCIVFNSNWQKVKTFNPDIYKSWKEPIRKTHEKCSSEYKPSQKDHDVVLYKADGYIEYWKEKKKGS